MRRLGLSSLLLRATESDLEARAHWYIRTRWFFLIAIAFPAVVSNLVSEGFTDQVQRDLVLAFFALSSNLIFLLLSRLGRKNSFYRLLIIFLISVDIATILAIIYTKGGVESRSPILFTIPILMASAIFGKKGVYLTAFAGIILYDVLILLDWANVIHSINAVNPELRFRTPYMLNTIAFFSSVLLIIATLADFIVRLLEEKERVASSAVEALEQAQSIAQLGSWKWDIKDNSITFSKQLYKMFKMDPTDAGISLETYLNHVHPDDRQKVQRVVARALKDLQPFRVDHRFHLSDNEDIWIHSEGQVESEGGEAKFMFGTAQDVSEQIKSEKDLIKQRKELEKLNALMVGRELKMIELKEKINNQKNRNQI